MNIPANEESQPVNDPVVIADECGDTLWDAVLIQEIHAGSAAQPQGDIA